MARPALYNQLLLKPVADIALTANAISVDPTPCNLGVKQTADDAVHSQGAQVLTPTQNSYPFGTDILFSCKT